MGLSDNKTNVEFNISKTYQNLHIHMSIPSFKEVMVGGYPFTPMMLPLLKAVLELSLEPSAYYFEYPQWWQIFVFWGWVSILETSLWSQVLSIRWVIKMVTATFDQNQTGPHYKVMSNESLSDWVTCVCAVSCAWVLKTLAKRTFIVFWTVKMSLGFSMRILRQNSDGVLVSANGFLVCFTKVQPHWFIVTFGQFSIWKFTFFISYNFTLDRLLLPLGNNEKSQFWKKKEITFLDEFNSCIENLNFWK